MRWLVVSALVLLISSVLPSVGCDGQADEQTMQDAKAYVDGLSSQRRTALVRLVQEQYDSHRCGALQRCITVPGSLSILRVYDQRSWQLARRVAQLPTKRQQELYDYLLADPQRRPEARPEDQIHAQSDDSVATVKLPLDHDK